MARINFKKTLKIAGKLLLWIFVSILGLMLLIVIGLQVPYVQRKIINLAISKVSEKVDTEISLGSFDVILPNYVRLNQLFIAEPSGDTLLYAGKISTRIGLPELIGGNLSISKFTLEKAVANITREEGDSLFNFNFIIEAFSNPSKNSTGEDGNKPGREETSPADSTGKPFSIGRIELKDIRVLYDDGYTGNYVKAEIGDFFVSFSEFNLSENILDINRTGLSNSSAVVKLAPSMDTTTVKEPLAISLRRISRFKNITVSLEMPGTSLQVNHANLRINPEEVNTQDKKIGLKRVLISESEIIYSKTKTEKGTATNSPRASVGQEKTEPVDIANGNAGRKGSEPKNTNNSFDWNISVSSLRLRDNHLVYTDHTSAHNPGAHTLLTNPDLNNLSAYISDIHLANDLYQANIEDFSFRDKQGLVLKELTAKLDIKEKSASLKDLKILTNNSVFYNTTIAQYPSFQNIGQNLGDVEINTQIKKSRISPADIRYFAPGIATPLNRISGTNGNIYLSGSLSGKVKDLKIENFEANNDENLFLALNGQIRGLPDAKNAYYKVNLDSLTMKKDHILAFMPDSAIPQNISLPENISLKGNFVGVINDFRTKFNLITSQGSLQSDVQLASLTRDEPKKFSGFISIDDYNLGQLLKNDSAFGEIKMKVSFGGQGSNKKNLQASLGAVVEKFEANQYRYQDISLGGTFNKEHFYGNVTIKDTNLVAEFNGEAALGDSVPRYDFTLVITGADLQALNLSDNDLRLGGTFVSNFEGNSIEDINGFVKAKNFIFLQEDETYRLDSLVAEATNEPGKTKLEVASPFLNGKYEGTVPFNKISPMIRDYFTNYFDLYKDSTLYASSEEEFTLDVKISDSKLLTEIFIPDLVSFMPATIEAEYKGNKASFDLQAQVPRVNYQGRILDTLHLDLSSDRGSFRYNGGFRHILSDPFEIGETTLSGKADSDSILWNFTNKSMNEKESLKYSLSGSVEARNDFYYVKLLKDSVLINGTNFGITKDNSIRMGKTRPFFNSFILTSADQKLEISTDSSGNGQAGELIFDFSKFRLSNLTGLVEAGENIFDGLINGNLVLASKEGSGSFSSDLKIGDLRLFNEDAFNEINIKADNRTKGKINLDASMTGPASKLSLSGNLNTLGDTTDIQADLEIEMLDLSVLEPFFPENINKLNGELTGTLAVSNSISNPLVNGKLNFNSVNVNPAFINTNLNLEDETIVFNGRKVSLTNFRLKDPKGNLATLKGSIDATKMNNPTFDLQFNADHFQLLNTKEGTEKMFYGQVVADLDVRLNGSARNPDISLDVALGENTDFYFIVSQAGSASIEREGIVEFVEMDDSTGSFHILTREDSEKDVPGTNFGSMNLNANINIDNAAKFNIVVDPATEEILEVKGDANLSYAMNTSGQSTLAGNYNITEGTYTLKLYGVIKRTFTIDKGSSMTWTGELANPQMDLATYYRVKTSPEPILVTQTTSTDGTNQNFDNMNFDVYMYIKGKLMDPELNFGISLPAGQRNALVETALTRINRNETEVNKQVFSLLLLKSFIQSSSSADNSLAYTINATARKGIGNLLSQQINNFSEQYIKGFKLNVDIESYAGGGAQGEQGRTNVQANVSKQLFDERLTVKVGGSANIEDPNQSNNNRANMSTIAGDVEVEYKLTENGTYLLQGFRKTEYEDVLDGELRKTGIAIIFNKDFYHFKNLFGKKKKNDQDIHSQ